MSSYVQHYLGLSRNCRTFEVKHACFGGTAALQAVAATLRCSTRPDARALVITTDVARPIPHTYAEPSQGAAAIALLLGPEPRLLELELATGSYGFEVMDSCRPSPDIETGDPDLSLLTYLDCIRGAFTDYQRETGADFVTHFDGLAFHTPFGGMAKGAHRSMMRDQKRLPPAAIEADFERRLRPSLTYCAEVGNVYSGSVMLAACGAIEALATPPASGATPPRLGLFSYGSGCCLEFYSGLVMERAAATLAERASPRPSPAGTRSPCPITSACWGSTARRCSACRTWSPTRRRSARSTGMRWQARACSCCAGSSVSIGSTTGLERMEDPVQLSRRGRLLVLRLHRESHNSIDSAMLLAIDAALNLAEADPAIRTVLLEGNAEVFCTGLDLKAALGGGDGAMDRRRPKGRAEY